MAYRVPVVPEKEIREAWKMSEKERMDRRQIRGVLLLSAMVLGTITFLGRNGCTEPGATVDAFHDGERAGKLHCLEEVLKVKPPQ